MRVVAVLCAMIALLSLGQSGDLHASELRRTAIVKAVQSARAAVVNIHGHKTIDDQQQSREVNGMGTGVILDPRGYILTNHHVVNGVRKIRVTLVNRQTFSARIISHDVRTDLAIIKINAPEKLNVIRIGTSADIMTGEPVVAVGNAFGYEHTVTRGIISALHRTVQVSENNKYHDLIQTDASINPGNSGGPLLNIDGEMIGINVAVRAGAQGIGFAIPVDKALAVAAQLLSAERVQNTWHGVVRDSHRSTLKHRFVVGTIEKKSPADKSGFLAGDVIQTVGKTKIQRQLDFERALLGRHAGDEVEVTVVRKSEPLKLSLVLSKLPGRRQSVDSRSWRVLGLRLNPVPTQKFRTYKSRYRGGLSVASVRPDSPAARQGIRTGDVLVGMHVWETISVDNVDFVLDRDDLASFSPIKFYLLREGSTLYGHLPISVARR